jgi:hypothetical protein
MTNISRNSDYKIIFNNTNDKNGTRNLLNQQCYNQDDRDELQRMFKRVTRQPRGYLICDATPTDPEDTLHESLRYVSDIFNPEGPTYWVRNEDDYINDDDSFDNI